MSLFGADALAMLADADGSVGDYDYVGAPNVRLKLDPAAMQTALAKQNQLAKIGLAAIARERRIDHDRKVRQAALAGFVPQFAIPASAAGITPASGALLVNALPGVPCRVTKLIVSQTSAPFFGISNIAAGRMTLVSGGQGMMPADAFSPLANQTPMDNPELSGGSPITITGQNLDTVNPHLFVASFYAVDKTPDYQRVT